MSVLESRVEAGVCHVTLTRPGKLNALNQELVDSLIALQIQIRDDQDVKVVLVTAQGPSFCAGADLEHIGRVYQDPTAARLFLNTLRDVIVGFERLPQPVVAAVQGHILAGGLELMMGFDIVVAAESSRIGDQHMRRGFIPGGGNTQRLPQRLGKLRALDLLLTGRWLSASEAAQIGLVSRVAPDVSFVEEASSIAEKLATKSREALAQVKRLTHLATGVPLADGLELEIEVVMDFYDHPGFLEALESFTERVR